MSNEFIVSDAEKELVKKQKANYTEEEFQAMHPKVLRMFAQANGKANMPEPYLSQSKERGFNDADRALARRVLMKSGARNIAHERPEDFTRVQGGRTVYYPGKIESISLSGEVKTRPNSPVPVPFGHIERYPNSVPMAAFCSQLVKNDGGTWLKSTNDHWIKAFGNTFVAVENLDELAGKVIDVLTRDQIWKNFSPIERSSVTGLSALTFIRLALERMDLSSWLILNTKVVCDGFRTFSKYEGEWELNMLDQDRVMVPASMYERVDNDKVPVSTRALLENDYPGCFLYRGGALPDPKVPQSLGTLDSAKKSGDKLREVLGKDISTSNILAEMRDFSGLTDFFGKKMAFFLSSTLSCWQRGLKVDIQLESIGDAAMLVSSLNFWISYLTDEKKRVTASSDRINAFARAFPEVDQDWFSLMIPSIGTIIPLALKPLFRDNVRKDAVFIMWCTKVLPTGDIKGVKVDYDLQSQDILVSKAKQNPYILSAAIYGHAPFQSEDESKKRVSQRMVVFQKWDHVPYVYKFSSCAHFRGILSSLKDLSLVGFGFPKNPDGSWDERGGNRLLFVSLKCFESQHSWYKEVSDDCNRQLVSFFCPVVRYSPITNLVRMSKNAIIISHTQVLKEDGDQYVVTSHVEKKTRGRRIVAWGESPSTTAMKSNVSLSSSVVPSSSSSSVLFPTPPVDRNVSSTKDIDEYIPHGDYEETEVERFGEDNGKEVEKRRDSDQDEEKAASITAKDL